MKISTQTRYGTRAMIELAPTWEGGLMTVSQVSEAQDLPRKYLEQIMAKLKSAKLITAIPNSGYKLARAPEAIYMDEIYMALEPKTKIVDCEDDGIECPRKKGCVAKCVWDELSSVVEKFFSEISLIDVINGSIPEFSLEKKNSDSDISCNVA